MTSKRFWKNYDNRRIRRNMQDVDFSRINPTRFEQLYGTKGRRKHAFPRVDVNSLEVTP